VASGTQTPIVIDESEEEDVFMPDGEEEPEDDFDEDVVEEDSDEDAIEHDDDSEDDYAGRRRIATPELNIVEIHSDHTPGPIDGSGRRRKGPVPDKPPRKRVKPSERPITESTLRTRGVADFTKVGGQEVRLKDLFGPKNEDLKNILLTRDHWAKQETLPLREPGSLRRSFHEKPEAREKETKVAREWYANTGREAFVSAQKCRDLTADEAAVYLANGGEDSLNVLCGPVDHQQVYALKKLSYLNVAEPFKEKKNRRGWLFNLGSRIQDAQWTPNEHGSTQYLAVAVEQRDEKGPDPKLMDNPKAPAFSATAQFPASIQIWALDANESGELDIEKQPRLQMVVCTDWGAPKYFRWCPVGPENGGSNNEQRNNVHIGLLASIWSDGRVRILDISCSSNSSETQYVHISHAAFDVSIPQTVPTCLRWLSGTTLSVSTAIGTLAIWTLSQPDLFSPTQTPAPSPKPWFYQQLSDTYILSLSSGWPSQPHFISITTADGFARLYDIRTPNADTTASIRGRTLCYTQDWHEQTQSFIAPDEQYMLKHNPIRRYYHNLYSMRANSSITRCAASPVHPAVLIGGADGRIESTNPIGRITNYKTIPWQQTWFAHEWRGPVSNLIKNDKPDGDVDMNEGGPVGGSESSVPQSFLENPLARISEGYKAIQPGIQHSVVSKKTTNPEVAKGITVFEEKSAVTALAWNPNLKYGMWAVAGLGSGLLRVEDVGV
jgi:transcription factor C subunit 6